MFAIFQRKTTIADSGILEGFTDRHSHILPGVDDGFQTLPDSLEALQAIEQLGVAEQWLTPHIMEDYPNTPDDLHARFEKLKESYTGKLRLHLAAEHMLDTLFLQRFAERIPPAERARHPVSAQLAVARRCLWKTGTGKSTDAAQARLVQLCRKRCPHTHFLHQCRHPHSNSKIGNRFAPQYC